MREIKETSQFKKDLKKLAKSGKHSAIDFNEFLDVVPKWKQ
jgi:mRNA-degrading endonuclease YafQ of YafQ-DinJ toxin-antitoxin module